MMSLSLTRNDPTRKTRSFFEGLALFQIHNGKGLFDSSGEHLGSSGGVIGDEPVQTRFDETIGIARPHDMLLADKGKQ